MILQWEERSSRDDGRIDSLVAFCQTDTVNWSLIIRWRRGRFWANILAEERDNGKGEIMSQELRLFSATDEYAREEVQTLFGTIVRSASILGRHFGCADLSFPSKVA